MAFVTRNGSLYCEGLRITEILSQVPDSPFYLYSRARLEANYRSYAAVAGSNTRILYAVKANHNRTLLEILRERGAGAVLVSGNELALALSTGFSADRLLLNGNGKSEAEIEQAIQAGVLLNVDSVFDFERITGVAERIGRVATVLLRVNPDIEAAVHPYVATGMRESKFGVGAAEVAGLLPRFRATSSVALVGLHCHLGSTIDRVSVFREAARVMMSVYRDVCREGFPIRFLDVGGGLDINYRRSGSVPSGSELLAAIRGVVDPAVELIVEPGRSLVGDAGVLIGRVLGVKQNGGKRFIVTDASMTELIRPSLYDAYHHISFPEPVSGPLGVFDVVGPVCESGDFLARDRELAAPSPGTGIVIHDAGAYGYAMSSNYNLRPRPAEYLVDGHRLTRIRRPETFDDMMHLY